jgi:hypothetical protein
LRFADLKTCSVGSDSPRSLKIVPQELFRFLVYKASACDLYKTTTACPIGAASSSISSSVCALLAARPRWYGVLDNFVPNCSSRAGLYCSLSLSLVFSVVQQRVVGCQDFGTVFVIAVRGSVAVANDKVADSGTGVSVVELAVLLVLLPVPIDSICSFSSRGPRLVRTRLSCCPLALVEFTCSGDCSCSPCSICNSSSRFCSCFLQR